MVAVSANDPVDFDEPAPHTSVWRQLSRLWCRHAETHVTPRRGLIPPHIVCDSCGWREPAPASEPRATRTWDSTRDESRYELEKKRRVAADQQRLVANAVRGVPTPRAARVRRSQRSNIVEMKRPVAG